MTFIEVRDDLIVSIVSAAAGYSTKEYKVYQVPDYFNGIEGDNIKHFDSEWHRLTDKQLYEAGLIPLNENYKMNEDGSFSEKTIKEKIADGIITLAADEKLEVDKIIKKTDIELMQDGLKPIPEGQKIATDKIVYTAGGYVSHGHSVSVDYNLPDGYENIPDNYTIRIWERRS